MDEALRGPILMLQGLSKDSRKAWNSFFSLAWRRVVVDGGDGLLYLEDLEVGASFPLGPTQVELERMLSFAEEFDPQPFHVDEEAAKQSPYGGLIASGWFTCSLCMRMMYEALLCRAAGLGSPGVYEIAWPAPVRAGETLRGELRILDKRMSAAVQGRGSVLMRCELWAVDPPGGGEGIPRLVMTATFRALFRARGLYESSKTAV